MPTQKPNRTREIIDKIFGDHETLYSLKEFDGIDFEQALNITEEEKDRYSIKDIKSGSMKFVYDEKKDSGKPEEIVRQLIVYKLHHQYKYPLDRIDTEKSIHFGREIHKKAADIVVTKSDKITPYIIVEVKSPTESKGIEQLKSYLAAEGAEIGLWSNGSKRIILYRPYPKEFDDTLPDLPSANQTIDDLFETKRTYFEYTSTKENLKDVVDSMEELVLANAGVDVFTEVFKLIYAKMYDEHEAKLSRSEHEVHFRKYRDPSKTYAVINDLFKSAIKKWPGTFYEQENINLSQEQIGRAS